MNSINYTHNKASKEDIKIHLKDCNTLFSPHLSTYVDIHEYAEKIKTNAFTFEGWENNRLIGLVACYLNDKKKFQGYITNVSTSKDYQGKGIAKHLLEQTTNKTLEFGFKSLSLEVEVNNIKAISLYQHSGFVLSGRIGSKYSMIKRL